jgi:hypothetical protein
VGERVQAPSPFWKAIAPSIAAIIMSVRACRFPGSRTATGSDRAARRTASSATASASGWKPAATYASRPWVKASIPVAAVSRGGRSTVSSGSQIATRGMRNGLKMTVLRPVSGSVATPERPTSDPVPAVVGIATSGGMSSRTKRSPPAASS